MQEEFSRVPAQAAAQSGLEQQLSTPSVFERIRGFIADLEWLEPIADYLQNLLGRGMDAAGPRVTDLFHGTWLRHPLHVALTDVPIGAWTAATTMDLLGAAFRRQRMSAGADAAVALGVAAAVPTALSGLADYRHVYGYPRKIGLLHAGLNVVGVLLQGTSLAMRVTGRRRTGVALSGIGFASMLGAAWLGGELVEKQGIGVDHSAFPAGPSQFTAVLAEVDLPEGRLHRAHAGAASVLLYRAGNEVFAMAERCSHQGGPLSKGRLGDGIVTCPWHGSQFRVKDGTLVHGPSTFDQPRYEVRIRDGQIEVRQASPGQ